MSGGGGGTAAAGDLPESGDRSGHNAWSLPAAAADATTAAGGANAVSIRAKGTGDAAGAAGQRRVRQPFLRVAAVHWQHACGAGSQLSESQHRAEADGEPGTAAAGGLDMVSTEQTAASQNRIAVSSSVKARN
ncbi:MAG: hypothetical protein F4117_13775 [Acidimicrobiales bacterium]|nr:hypothetical protein [Acidimicrobiales bacterium]MYI13617.1 hypothetical protein [Acidimicrobiales bacterium]